MRLVIVIGLLAALSYVSSRDVWYFEHFPTQGAAPLADRTPGIQGLDGTEIACAKRNADWTQQHPSAGSSCRAVPAFRHWLALAGIG